MNWAMLGGSLVSVLALAGFAAWLGLGGDVRIGDHDDAKRIAHESGFDAEAVIVDRAGMGALARDAAGRFMLIRRHGAHFVTRLLELPVDGRLHQRFLTLGQTTLDLGDDAAVWAASLRRLA